MSGTRSITNLLPVMLLLPVLAGAYGAESQPLPRSGPVQVARWMDAKAAAIALVFDDGLPEQVQIAVPMLDALGLKATFVISPGKVHDGAGSAQATGWDDWRRIAASGHEIGNHSMTHPNFGTTAAASLEQEIVGAQRRIAAEIGMPCVTFCYPYNAETPESRALVAATHAVSTGGERKAYGGAGFTVEQANAWVDAAIASHSLLTGMIHAIEKGYSPFANRAVFQSHLDYIAGKQAQLWIAPLGTIGRYRREVAACTLTATMGDHRATILLTSPLDEALYAVPLTVTIACDGTPTDVVAVRAPGTTTLPATCLNRIIRCAIAPSAAPVTVTWR